MKYAEDKFWIEELGLEECKRRDAFAEDVERRESEVVEKAFSQKEELFRAINEKTGLNLKFTMEKREKRNGDVVLDIESEEIKNPIIALAWKSFKIENFGGSSFYKDTKKDNERDYSKFATEVGYYMSIHFGYEHIDRGSNGARIGDAQFLESTGHWQFKLYGER